ncbi:hypothetical protein Gotri_022302 [Gossypium trilobum]|uniref:uridine/cytidine kinase n=1 Tax=Gossypium trilobum TaxID=34281 RepID=A0A7J9DF66_9ROSI|nr:hypothetical protein [Gossypium trilobum]
MFYVKDVWFHHMFSLNFNDTVLFLSADAFDTEKLLDSIENLRHDRAVDIPNYDFKSYKSNAFPARRVNPSDVIILEGILIFHDPRVRELMNMKIFVDTDADVRLARRIRRDTVDKGRDIGAVLDQYSKFVKPAFDDFILPTKKYADIIIPRGGDNHVAIDLIVQHIRTKLGQHDLCKIYPNLYVIQSTFQIRGMHTLIRDSLTTKHDFVFYSDRLIRLVVEHGLGHLPFTEKQVITPTGSVYTGVDFCKRLCGVSVIRSGESMENALRACCKGIKIGKILIHREGDNGQQVCKHNYFPYKSLVVLRCYKLFYRQFSCSSYFLAYKKGCTRVQHHISQSHICTSGCTCGVQKLPKIKDCNV